MELPWPLRACLISPLLIPSSILLVPEVCFWFLLGSVLFSGCTFTLSQVTYIFGGNQSYGLGLLMTFHPPQYIGKCWAYSVHSIDIYWMVWCSVEIKYSPNKILRCTGRLFSVGLLCFASFMRRGTASFCSRFPFQGYLYNEWPWKR